MGGVSGRIGWGKEKKRLELRGNRVFLVALL